MAGGCGCNVVGNLKINGIEGCVISLNMSSRVELIKECNETALFGPSTGTASITAYALDIQSNTDVNGEVINSQNIIYTGCGGSASVNIPWVRRYDCDSDVVYLINGGAGSASIAGEVDGLAELITGTNIKFRNINANSNSGPATFYTSMYQEDGYGLVYTGYPIPFDTSDESTLIFENLIDISEEGAGTGTTDNSGSSSVQIGTSNGEPVYFTSPTMYLQNFNLEMRPGEIPVATYTFQFVI